ncbi:hypothetical protein NKK48_29090 [Mesorhizobium sp. C386A]|uniref:hypothetical protein n=1 Tax=unclassified Mesorhizobium TaxID=325217 RepID=UPI0003CE47F8|nr:MULTISPECIES: hypothetical protein [unclassified Mesorhizobium]ESY09157.1 hypothetical protein X752_21125 [Mesorhizobium sp. LNJC398B00]ESY32065.1 hypothetical protein X748_24135 [Mesorhizobium sp. LNJC386A00]
MADRFEMIGKICNRLVDTEAWREIGDKYHTRLGLSFDTLEDKRRYVLFGQLEGIEQRKIVLLALHLLLFDRVQRLQQAWDTAAWHCLIVLERHRIDPTDRNLL